MRWWTSHAPLLLQEETTSSQPVQLMHPLTSIQSQRISRDYNLTTQTVIQIIANCLLIHVYSLYNNYYEGKLKIIQPCTLKN